jgi:hypothetical protein
VKAFSGDAGAPAARTRARRALSPSVAGARRARFDDREGGSILSAMRRSSWLRASLVALALALAPHDVARAARETRFFSARQGVGVQTPSGWTLSLQTGYPEILCVLLHPDGSRISLSAAPTKAADAKALAEQSRRGIEAQRLAVTRVGPGPRGGVLLEARGAQGGRTGPELRQLYFVRGAGPGKSQAIVLTLSTRAETLTAASTAFDWTVSHLALEPPLGADEPDAKSTPAARKPDAGAAADAGH